MVEALRTSASTAGLWVIVVLMSVLTAVLVSAPLVADSVQTRVVRRRRRLGELGLGPVPADTPIPAAADPAEQRAQSRIAGPEQVGQGLPGTVPWPRTGQSYRDQPAQGDIPTRADLPAQRGGAGDQAAFSQGGQTRPGPGGEDAAPDDRP